MCYAKPVFALSLLCAAFPFLSKGQDVKYEVGLNLGAYIYQGDLAPGAIGSLKTIRPGLGLSFAKPMSSVLSLQANLTAASIAGNDAKYSTPAWRPYRAFKFSSTVRELNVSANFYPLALWGNTGRWQPYVHAGGGIAFRRVSRDYSNMTAAYFGEAENLTARIAQDMAVNPSKPTIVAPVGMGVRYDLSHRFLIDVNTSYRLDRTDYLDGFSIAADPKKKDHYTGVTAGMVYKIGVKGKGLACPKVRP